VRRILEFLDGSPRLSDVPVVVLTAQGDRSGVFDALNNGAGGYLLKDDEPDDLARGVRAAARGDIPLSPQAARALVNGAAGLRLPVTLTRREHDVLALLAEGLSNKLIARRLGISEKTVKAHLSAAFRRIGAEDRTQAALWFLRHAPRPVAAHVAEARPVGS